MKITDIPHNMEFTLNEELKEVAKSPAEMKKGITLLIDALPEKKTSAERGQVAAMAGVYSRIVGDFEASEKLLNEAIEHFETAEKKLMVCYGKSRLAVTQFSLGKYDSGEKHLEECLKALMGAKSNPAADKIVVYCLDQYARNKYQRGLLQEAMDRFLQAHERTLMIGDMEMMNQLSEFISKVKNEIELVDAEKKAKDAEMKQMEEDFKNRTGE